MGELVLGMSSDLGVLIRQVCSAIGFAREVICGLIERVAVGWEGGQAVVVLDGALTPLVGLATNAKGPASAGPFGVVSNSSVKVVAGAGFEPAAFRL